MPLYEYECKTCGEVMETFQHMNDEHLTEMECPKCQTTRPVKKIITGMHFTLIGRGWAKDGYVNTYEQTLADI